MATNEGDPAGDGAAGNGIPTQTAADGNSGTSGAEAPKPPLVINAQYVKDLSFEAPGAPGVFAQMQQNAPDISINIDVRATPLRDTSFEVVTHVKASCKVDDTVAFLLELSYGGVFTLNVAREHVQPVLLVECPRLLFPFVRNIVSDATRDGGFPPLMLGPVDFAAMYQQQVQRRQTEAGAPPEA